MSAILVGSAILGLLQSGIAMGKLARLNKRAYPNYGITPEQQLSYNTAQNNARFGYQPAQRSAFINNINTSQNAAYQRAVDTSGGQQSNAIFGILKANKLGAYGQFAAQDASLQQQNQHYADQMGQNITQQRNLATQADINYRMAEERAWGGALQAGTTNIASAINFKGIADSYATAGTTPTTRPARRTSYRTPTKMAIKIR